MIGFDLLTGIAIPISMNNVDTDQIFPTRFQSKRRSEGMYGNYFLHDIRYDDEGNVNAGFVMNDKKYGGAKFIVAAENYACGSARLGAIFSHIDFGIRAVIAESFGPVFPTVAYKSGLLTLQLEGPHVRQLRALLLESRNPEITIDLRRKVVVGPDRAEFSFEIEDFIRRMFMEGVNEIDLTRGFHDRIAAFEARQREKLPWIYDRH